MSLQKCLKSTEVGLIQGEKIPTSQQNVGLKELVASTRKDLVYFVILIFFFFF